MDFSGRNCSPGKRTIGLCDYFSTAMLFFPTAGTPLVCWPLLRSLWSTEISRPLCGRLSRKSGVLKAGRACFPCYSSIHSAMSFATRLKYYRRILSAYLFPGQSQLTFWHDVPRVNPNVQIRELGEYYMPFVEKADYSGQYDSAGIPLLDYHGDIGLQYNPIAIAQWGLGNYNLFLRTNDEERKKKFLSASDWLCSHLEQNGYGIWVWNHHFDWEYRTPLKAPWYSALAQGQGISLLVRAHHTTGVSTYLRAAGLAYESFLRPTGEGGITFTDERGDLWFEEYVVSPPTHILNGFIWATWGVYDYLLATKNSSVQDLFDQAV